MNRPIRRRPQAQRGVVLLIVISLLVLFVLIAVTFAVVAGQYRQAAAAQVNIDATGDQPRKDLEMAAYMALRGTNMTSPLARHSLLEDLYGDDSAGGQVVDLLPANAAVDVAVEAGGQFVRLQFNPSTAFAPQAGHYNGCVLTFLSGPATGCSTRIVGYTAPTFDAMGALQSYGELRYESHDADGTAIPYPRANDRFGINGREFNGTGAGYDTSTGNIDSEIPITGVAGLSGGVRFRAALLPNYAAYESAPQTTSGMRTNIDVLVGGADESFDAPSFHDMWLAYLPNPTTAMNSTDSLIFPSYHRPDLVAYWFKRLTDSSNPNALLGGLTPAEQAQVFNLPFGADGIENTADDNAAPWSTVQGVGSSMGLPSAKRLIAGLKRLIVMRPMQQDHPNFTGGNPNFSLTGQLTGNSKIWDVDNDGDGIPDSVWIDPGLPVATSPDGRRYKKLFAFLIRDLDGRININAAGAAAHLNANYTNAVNGQLAGSPGAVNLARGLGFGPADLSLSGIFGTNHSAVVTGRYGADGVPGALGDDTLSWIKSVGIPNDYNAGPQAYGSPPDLSGQGAVAVDHFGQPVTGFMGQNGETTDDPYEFDPLRGKPSDSRYTLGEFERIVRYYDQDANALPQRLLYGAASSFTDARVRRAVTTHSAHLPLPNVQFGAEVRNPTTAPAWTAFLTNTITPTILDLYRARLRQGLGGAATAAQIDTELTKIVPFEILHGRPFDLNRWLGNGLDDNGNNAVDEHNEAATGETVWNGAPPASFTGVAFNYTNDATAAVDARQMYARQLYSLMRVLLDDQYVWQPQAGTDDASVYNSNLLRQQFHYRRLAQWAINAVEFRDRDAVMSPFEYDENPFNGWICDGNPATDEGNDGVDNDGDGNTDEADERERKLVWGAEYPDLLLTETLSFHDRGVRDTEHDDLPATPQLRWDSGTNRFRDNDVDQYRKPQGSTFVEVYCSRNFPSNNASMPMELYDGSGNLDLGRLAPARTFGMSGQQTRHPVWRAVITQSPPAGGISGIEQLHALRPESQIFEPLETNGNTPTVERIVWFSPHDPANLTTPDADRIFYGRTGNLLANPNSVNAQLQVGSNVVLPPNRHLVVAPRAATALGAMRDGMDGDRNTLDLSPHQLQVNGGIFSIVGGFYSTAAFGYPVALPAMGATIPTPLGIVCAAKPPTVADGWNNQAAEIGLNVSEPLPRSGGYYREPTYPNDAYADLSQPFVAGTNAVPDTPFDRGQPGTPLEGKIRTGTYMHHRSIYLQRLANPLLPWNPDPNDPDFGSYHSAALALNPYLTIDWSSMDLTVFSGNMDNTEETGMDPGNNTVTEWIDTLDPNPYGSAPSERFETRERGVMAGMTESDNLWSPLTTDPAVSNASTGDPDHYFNRRLTATLGYLNSTYGTPQTPATGYEGSPFRSSGQPNPFSWLAWNNRPYANPLELLLVPHSAPSRLGVEFSNWNASTWNPYLNEREKFTHLLNFFQTAAPGAPAASAAPQYARIFDYVETPSPFVGTERWFNPQTFAGDPNARMFRPPYNRLSRFRDPGRVNLNTIADELEWQAVEASFGYSYSGPTDSSSFAALRRSRSGLVFGGSADDYPSWFGNPFRTAASADLMPNVRGMRRAGVDATLLRSLPPSGAAALPAVTNPTISNSPQFVSAAGQQYQQTDKNAYFRYRGVNRLSNLLTTHSNTFAIWITVGYFEVEDNPNGPDVGHPDGYRLGAELGADSGTTKRHRAFYIFDRTIPVAFERGQNHNIDRAILLRRFIE